MKFLDKINNAAKKATDAVTQKTQGLLGGSKSGSMDTPKGSHYIPNPVDLANSVPKSTGIEDNTPWENVIGQAKTFPFMEKSINVHENLDAFNTYRTIFLNLARRCADKAKQEYADTVHDYVTFMELFPQIYDSNLYPLIKKAMDVLLSEGLFSVTFETFAHYQKSNYHKAIDDYGTMVGSTNLTIEQNRDFAAGVLSTASKHMGSQLDNDTAKSLFDKFAASQTSQAVNKTGITAEQQVELYNRLNLDNLFLRIYLDYVNVLTSLISVLNKNGKNVWFLTKQAAESTKNIFQNLNNPSFPQDKVLEVFIELIETNPYNPEYYQFMESKFGDTEETRAIREYFGFEDIAEL